MDSTEPPRANETTKSSESSDAYLPGFGKNGTVKGTKATMWEPTEASAIASARKARMYLQDETVLARLISALRAMGNVDWTERRTTNLDGNEIRVLRIEQRGLRPETYAPHMRARPELAKFMEYAINASQVEDAEFVCAVTTKGTKARARKQKKEKETNDNEKNIVDEKEKETEKETPKPDMSS